MLKHLMPEIENTSEASRSRNGRGQASLDVTITKHQDDNLVRGFQPLDWIQPEMLQYPASGEQAEGLRDQGANGLYQLWCNCRAGKPATPPWPASFDTPFEEENVKV